MNKVIIQIHLFWDNWDNRCYALSKEWGDTIRVHGMSDKEGVTVCYNEIPAYEAAKVAKERNLRYKTIQIESEFSYLESGANPLAFFVDQKQKLY